MKHFLLCTTLILATQAALADKAARCHRDLDCRAISNVILGEARGESAKGQRAVGYVVRNRTKHSSFPNSERRVVQQRGQFHTLSPRNKSKVTNEEKRKALEAAYDVKRGIVRDPTRGSTHFHSVKKHRPYWARSKDIQRTVRVEKHVFYKMKEKK